MKQGKDTHSSNCFCPPISFRRHYARKYGQHIISIFTSRSHSYPFTQTHKYLLSARVTSALFCLGPSPVRWWRYLHHLKRWWRYLHHPWRRCDADDLLITTKARSNVLTHNTLHYSSKLESDQFTTNYMSQTC